MISSSGARTVGASHAAAAHDATSSIVGVAADDRALKILAAFEIPNGILPLSAMAQPTGLYNRTILRIIASMERAAFLVQLPDRQLRPVLSYIG